MIQENRQQAARIVPHNADRHVSYLSAAARETVGAVTGEDIITIRIDGQDIYTLPFAVAYAKFAHSEHQVDVLDRGQFVALTTWVNYADAGDWCAVKFTNGRYLQMTSDHLLPTERGYVRCADLKIGDKIPIAAASADLHVLHPRTAPCDPWLLGLLVCDANCEAVVYLGMDERDVVDRVAELVRGDVVVKEMHRGPKGNYYDVYIRHGRGKCLPSNPMKVLFGGERKVDRCLPPDFLCWRDEERLQLLAGLIDADGSVKHANGCYIQLGTINKALAIEEMLLAKSLGFNAKMYHTTFGYGPDHIRYSVQFRLIREIPVVAQKKRDKMALMPPVKICDNAAVNTIEFLGHSNTPRYGLTTVSGRFDVSGLNICSSFL